MRDAEIRGADSSCAAVKTDASLQSATQKHVMSTSATTDYLFIAPMAPFDVIVPAKRTQTRPPIGKTTLMIDASRILFSDCRRGFLHLLLINVIDSQATLLVVEQFNFVVPGLLDSCESKHGLKFSGSHAARFVSTAYCAAYSGNPNKDGFGTQSD